MNSAQFMPDQQSMDSSASVLDASDIATGRIASRNGHSSKSSSEAGSESGDSNDNYGHGGCAEQPGPSESSSEAGSENENDASSPPSPVSSRVRADSNSSEPTKLHKRGRRKLDEEMLGLIESCPDAFGLRRSGRNRREVQRYTVLKSTDDEDSPEKRRQSTRKKRKDSDDWKGGGSTSEESGSDDASVASDDSGGARRPKRKQLTKRATAKKRSRMAYSSDEDSEADRKKKKSLRPGRAGKRVDYREDSNEEAIATSDVLEWSEEEPAAAAVGTVPGEEHETIEKILKQRIGKKGAVGSCTTAYNVEDRGDPNVINPGDDTEIQYLIKWVGWAHIHNTWESEESLRQNNVKGLRKLENYINRMNDIAIWKRSADKEAIEYFECEQEMSEELYDQYKIVERVITHSKSKDKGGDSIDYFVKWQGLPYAESTWEDANLIARWWKPKIDQYHQRLESDRIPAKPSYALRRRPKFVQLKSQPDDYLGGPDLRLRDYQLDGLNWLAYAWCKNNSVILADEMGLGKTIQTLSFLSYLYHEHDVFGPFLMVVPLSTLAAWQKECENWAPDLNLIVYLGDVGSREIIRQYEWYVVGTKKLKFNCVLTTYEILLKDKAFLGSFDWAALIVDEAHRLKNDESLLYKALISFSTNHRLLITGTPLQNSLKELWALLHFIMPERFDSWEEFERQHQGADKKGYASIHKELEPYLLRRVKKDVEKSLPAKVEQILRVDMTSSQKQYYKWILTRNYRALTKGVKGSISSFINIVMELKKCCNHAYLVRPPDVESTNAQERLQQIVRGSGKLILLDKLLCRLKQTGHRVLIFSQMVMVLDILQEYMRLRKFQFQRLDGSIRGDLRRQALDHFNAEGSTDFCFLLSTRAGGLGINLATADTVIIFDSDWNPQNDLQAQSRAHRIGQKKQVNIYRLVTKKSVEEDIVERAKRKLVLDHLVIQRMDTTGRTVLSKNAVSSTSSVPFNKEELASILKFGAEELFKENENEGAELEVDIDDILQRAETREMEDTSVGNELLDSFKVATFNIDEDETIEMGAAKKEATEDRDWESIIPEAERRKIEDEERQQLEAQMYLPPRQRNTLQQMARNEDPDDDWAPKRKKHGKAGDAEQSESSESEEEDHRRGRKPKKALFGFTDAEIRRFVRSVKKFGRPLNRLDAIACDAELEDHSQKEVKQLCEALLAACQQALHDYELEQKENVKEAASNAEEAAKKRDRGPIMKLGTSEFPVRPILRAHEDLEPLYVIMPETATERKHFRLPAKPKPMRNWDVEWTDDDDASLLRGVYEYGFGSWESIKMDPELGLAEKVILADKNKKPQPKHLVTRVDFLLKFLSKQKDIQQLMTVNRKPGMELKSEKTHPSEKKQKAKDPKKQKLATAETKQGNSSSTKKRAPQPPAGTLNKSDKKETKKRPKNVEVEEGEIDDDGPKVKQPKLSKIQAQKTPAKPLISAKTEHLTIDRNVDTNLDDGLFAECKELMKPVKKALKQLTSGRGQEEGGRSQNEPVRNQDDIMRCLLKIGDHISECLASKATSGKTLSKWHTYLWIFVSKFTEEEASELLKKYKVALKRRGELTEEPGNSSKGGFKAFNRDVTDKHRHHHRHRERHHYHREDRPDRPKKHEDEKASSSTSRPVVNGAGFGYSHSEPQSLSSAGAHSGLNENDAKLQGTRSEMPLAGRGPSVSGPPRSGFVGGNFRSGGGGAGGPYPSGPWQYREGASGGGYGGDRQGGAGYRREAYGGGSGPRGYGDGNRSNSGPGSYGNRGGNDRYGGGPSDRYGGGGPDRYGGGPGRPPGYEGPFDRRPGGGVGRDSYGSGYGGRRSPSPSSRGYDHFQ